MSTNRVVPLLPNPSLLIETKAERILVVGDLHIGWEISLMEKGIHLPSQAWRIRDGLLQIINKCEPNRIIFLGDVKHAIPRISLAEWKAVPDFFENIQNVVKDISVIVGNHDGGLASLIPSSVKIFPSTGLVVGKTPRIGLFHGHAWPTPEILSSELLVMGHVHPVIWFRDKLGTWRIKQVWIKGRCNGQKLAKAYLKYLKVKPGEKPRETLRRRCGILLNDSLLIIMPTFNDLIGGVSLNRFQKRLVGPFLGSGSVNVADSEVYLLDGTYLGTIKQVQTQLDTANL
jgi:putative SbcD/Mre11-related phosphoesterase